MRFSEPNARGNNIIKYQLLSNFHLQQKSSAMTEASMACHPQTDGAVFMVHRQPIALDRFTIHDVRPPDTSGT